MELFYRKSRGSITVLVTLILVPTIFFTGFMVDLARLKLYGNQAVMTADNYGEAVLTQYDNLLKELYGLFAVTQDTEAVKQLDTLQKYMTSSFQPNENKISWDHMQAVQGLLGSNELSGFMPYQSAKVQLSYSFPEKANLRIPEVFSTQVGDFMKFRIAQQLTEDGSTLLDAMETLQNTENNAKVINKKVELEEEVEKLLEYASEYYKALDDIAQYPQYITDFNSAYVVCVDAFDEIMSSASYQYYEAYDLADKDLMAAAVEKRDALEEKEKEGDSESGEEQEKEELTEDEEELVKIFDNYTGDENARKDKLKAQYNLALQSLADTSEREPISYKTYDNKINTLEKYGKKIKKSGTKISTLQEEIQKLLDEGNLDKDLKEGIQKDLDNLQELFAQIDLYEELKKYIDDNNTSVNKDYKVKILKILKQLEAQRDADLKLREFTEEPEALLDGSLWSDFKEKKEYVALYDTLQKTFGAETDEENNYGKTKKNAANKQLDDLEGELNQEKNEECTARNIPGKFGYGNSSVGTVFVLRNIIKNASDMFSLSGMENQGNRLLLKYYTVEYGFGMFSSRTTNVQKTEKTGTPKEPATTLLGYEINSANNYLYQAELEYLLGGGNNSKDNLNAARNKILAARGVLNYTATYRVKEVDAAIRTVQNAVMVLNPILGYSVGGLLRLAVTGEETFQDWKDLKEGKKVILTKNSLQDLAAYEKVKGLIEGKDRKAATPSGLALDYDQYLKLMLLFMVTSEQLDERMCNLIELNINAVRQKDVVAKDGALSELKFKLKDAHTAVNATCKVHLDFVVMPKGFARSVVDTSTYEGITAFEKNSYQFTVTRGY